MKRADSSEIKYLDFVRVRQSCDVVLFCNALLLHGLTCMLPYSTFLPAFKNKIFLDPAPFTTEDDYECRNGLAYMFLPRGFGDLRLTPVYVDHDLSLLLDSTCPIRLLVLLHRDLFKCTNTVQQLVSANPDIVVAGLFTSERASYSKLLR